MNRRTLLGTLALTGGITRTPRKTFGFQAYPQRTLLEKAEDRLNLLLALIPDTERFRDLQQSHQAWVDFRRQADAWNSPLEDAVSGFAYLGFIGDYMRRLGAHGFDQALSIERDSIEGDSQALAIWTGIDPHSVISLLRELNFEELDFGNITVLLQREVDLRRMFLGAEHRYIAILEEHNAIAFASSVELILEYAGSMAAGVPTLKDRGDAFIQPLIREVAWAQEWLSGELLNKSSAQFPLGDINLSQEKIETIRGLEHLEKTRFGVSPRVTKYSIGKDAGYTERNLRDPDEPPRDVVEGYPQPYQFISLKYESEADAALACDIIEWRWENALSWRSGETLAESHLPQPIDRSEIALGIITQTFESRSSYATWGMVHSPDFSIYGWGTLQ